MSWVQHVKKYAKCYKCINSFNPENNSRRQVPLYFHFKKEEIELWLSDFLKKHRLKLGLYYSKV